MKVTPAMVEAGVAALARVKKQNPVDEAIVASVFSHMYSAHQTEQARMAGVDTKVPYKHQPWPAWRLSLWYGGVLAQEDKPNPASPGTT